MMIHDSGLLFWATLYALLYIYVPLVCPINYYI